MERAAKSSALRYVGLALYLVSVLLASGAPELPGLVARASDGKRTVSFAAPTASFHLQAGQSIHPQLQPMFAVEWSGQIRILQGGKYAFKADAAVFINGKAVQSQGVELPAGNADLRIAYRRKQFGPARLQLQWESDQFPLEPVPASALFHSDTPQDLSGSEQRAHGRALIEEHNCTACHASELPFLRARGAPDLSSIGSRANANWVYKWLEDPQHFRASASMPRVPLTSEERADVAAYLGNLNEPRSGKTPVANADQGEALFNTIGCAACHGPQGISLAGVGSKYSAASLVDYLMDPLAADPSGRMPNMLLARAEADALSAYLIRSKNAEFEALAPHGNAERGRALVQERGCVNCHAVKDLVPKLVATRLRDLTPGKGCLADTPPNSVPRFPLSREQRASIDIWLQQPDVSEAPAIDVFRTVDALNCRQCHEFYRPAALTLDANQAPPPLSEAGHKLRRTWLNSVLEGRKRIRPWMSLRMPHYGSNNVPHLVDGLHAQAGSEFGEGDTLPQPGLDQVRAGVQLLGRGEGGLSCINCHDFRGQPSGGEMRGPDLTEMYARIRVDWLRRFLREPQRILPGTSMPTFFAGLPPDQTESQISRIIQGLAGGKDMPIPAGLAEAVRPFYLLVKDEPIVFRTFIEGSSPRSIAVGFPGLNSYVFDALQCRLRYAWSGDFLDVKPVWADRGGHEAKILGQRYFVAPDTFPIRIRENGRAPVVKFLGYRLIHRIPEFSYEVDGVLVQERIVPTANGLLQRLVVSGDAWFVGSKEPVRIVANQPFEREIRKGAK